MLLQKLSSLILPLLKTIKTEFLLNFRLELTFIGYELIITRFTMVLKQCTCVAAPRTGATGQV